MKFRPCIDIHNGKVKQIVGGSLTDKGDSVSQNYVSDKDAAYYADIYKSNNLSGGHIAMLNASGTEEYEATRRQAFKALETFPQGLQIGGGINADNAYEFLEAGASHVIVTSYVFRKGQIDFKRLDRLKDAVGSERIVLDLSCRSRNGKYYIVTDRWQRFTDVEVSERTFDQLSGYCDEFLVHAVDVEGRKAGIDKEVLKILSAVPYTVTYAGGVSDYEDIRIIRETGRGRVDVTIGSALSLFGGHMDLVEVLRCIR